MNAEAVIHVCKETMKQIKEKNPEVEINTDVLLPKLPPKTKGPHDDVVHANILPVCIYSLYILLNTHLVDSKGVNLNNFFIYIIDNDISMSSNLYFKEICSNCT